MAAAIQVVSTEAVLGFGSGSETGPGVRARQAIESRGSREIRALKREHECASDQREIARDPGPGWRVRARPTRPRLRINRAFFRVDRATREDKNRLGIRFLLCLYAIAEKNETSAPYKILEPNRPI